MVVEIVKTDKAAEILGLSPATLACWRSIGKGPPFVKCGQAVRYRLKDLELWLDRRVVDPEKSGVMD